MTTPITVKEEPSVIDSIAARMFAITRTVFAFASLLVVWVDPSPYNFLSNFLYALLGLHCVYSVVILAAAARHDWPNPPRLYHWIDLFFYISLVCLTGSTSSIFFPLLLFAVLAASFTHGFYEGLLATSLALAAFLLVGAAISLNGTIAEVDRLLIRLVYLSVLGYLLAYWGGQEKQLKERLALLHDINKGWDPRMGSDQLIGTNLNRLRSAFGGLSCVLVMRRPERADAVMYSAATDSPWRSAIPVTLSGQISELLVGEGDDRAIGYSATSPSWPKPAPKSYAFSLKGKLNNVDVLDCLEKVANSLETDALLTVPYSQRDGARGRLYLTGCSNCLSRSDLEFLFQASAAMAITTENVALIEAQSARASSQEREKISRDLHDVTIQPYIALKIAIEAAQRQANADDPMFKKLGDIVNMTTATIQELRHFSSKLKGQPVSHKSALEAGIRGQAERLKNFYNIEVALQLDVPEGVSEYMASAVFHIVSEGLSNILRHTSARTASVSIAPNGEDLLLQITNHRAGTEPPPKFLPRSVTERSHALGGTTQVDVSVNYQTRIIIRLPLVYSTT